MILKKIPTPYSFKLVSGEKLKHLLTSKALETKSNTELKNLPEITTNNVSDDRKRNFLKIAGVASAGIIASQLLPKKAEALIMGSTPSSSVVGVKDASNTRINPATEESLQTLVKGQGVSKATTNLSVSGDVLSPSSGKKLRIYSNRFSLNADATSVTFRFTSLGTDREKYISPKTGGLYGANNHPNYIEGGVDESFYCAISGTTTVQINVDYLEV